MKSKPLDHDIIIECGEADIHI